MKLPFATGYTCFSAVPVYLKAHRRTTHQRMHMLHMRISMDIMAVFFITLSPFLR